MFPKNLSMFRRTCRNASAALAVTLGCAILAPPLSAQWADCANATANSKQCVPSGNGNVGIGTTTPLNRLHLEGPSHLGLLIKSTGNGYATQYFQNTGRQWQMGLMYSADSPSNGFFIQDVTSGAPYRLVIDTSGNVGIGLTNPGNPLVVRGSVNAGSSPVVEWQDAAGYTLGFLTEDPTNYLSGALSLFKNNSATGGTFISANGNSWLMGGNVGIGTVSPATVLDVNGTIRSTAQTVPTSGAGTEVLYTAGNGYVTAFDRSASAWKPLHVNGAFLTLNAHSGGNVGIGTAAPTRKLDVNGTIGAREVVITNTGWADYVFKPGYKLSPLSEVAAFIKDNGHLPEIPSEAEVKQNGVSMGEMQSKLLAKIEELTLHMIQAEESNKRLENQNRVLQRQVEELAQLVGKQR